MKNANPPDRSSPLSAIGVGSRSPLTSTLEGGPLIPGQLSAARVPARPGTSWPSSASRELAISVQRSPNAAAAPVIQGAALPPEHQAASLPCSSQHRRVVALAPEDRMIG